MGPAARWLAADLVEKTYMRLDIHIELHIRLGFVPGAGSGAVRASVAWAAGPEVDGHGEAQRLRNAGQRHHLIRSVRRADGRDSVSDTPAQSTPSSGRLTGRNSCSLPA